MENTNGRRWVDHFTITQIYPIPETSTPMKYNLPVIHLDWNWIKDKKMMLDGNKFFGMLYITDEDDNIIQIYAYELVEKSMEEE